MLDMTDIGSVVDKDLMSWPGQFVTATAVQFILAPGKLCDWPEHVQCKQRFNLDTIARIIYYAIIAGSQWPPLA
mgnify:CR=1 FL=1